MTAPLPIAFRWTPRMVAIDSAGQKFTVLHTHHSGGAIVAPYGAVSFIIPVSDETMRASRPDTDDPATVGCLAHQVREALGNPRLFALYDPEPPAMWEIVRWDAEYGTVQAIPGNPIRGETEGQAWLAALAVASAR